MLVPERIAATGVMPIRVDCSWSHASLGCYWGPCLGPYQSRGLCWCSWGQSVVQAWATDTGRVCVHGSAVNRVWASVHGSCYYSEGHSWNLKAVLSRAPPLTGPRIAALPPPWTLQQESWHHPTLCAGSGEIGSSGISLGTTQTRILGLELT